MLMIEDLSCRIQGRLCLSVPQLEIKPGQLVATVGPNGAGKSTLLKAIAGDQLYRGTVTLHGRSLDQWKGAERARHIGFLPQVSQLTFAFSAYEVVALGLTPLTLSSQQGKRLVLETMKALDCAQFLNQSYVSLSGGERQRVHWARVLVQLSQAEMPPLLLLDEPTSAQDLGHQHHLFQRAQSYCRLEGFMIMTVIHDLNFVMNYCDRCLLVHRGLCCDVGTPREVLTQAKIETYWNYQPRAFLSTEEKDLALFF